MPLPPPSKARTLEKLRFFFNHTDDYPAEPGRALNFCEQVKSDVEEIIKAGLHKNVAGWGKICSDIRENRGFSQEQVAELLNVNHKTIQLQELKNTSYGSSENALNDIDPFYLESFSLIYNKSPYELLGLRSPHLICPLESLNNRVCKYSDLIITVLFDSNKPEKLTHLETIVKIGKLKLKKYRELLSLLENTTEIAPLFKLDPLDYLPENHNNWRKIRHPLPGENRRWYIFWEAKCVLEDLEQHNPIRLHTLAQLALCDEPSSKALRSIIFDIGYPKNVRSLHNYHINKLFAPAPKRRKQISTPIKCKRTRGRYRSITIPPDIIVEETQKTIFYYPNRPLAGILEEGQILVHNTSSFSSIHGYSKKLSDFVFALTYDRKISPAQGSETEKNGCDALIDNTYRISLENGFVYSSNGTAVLTESQVHELKEIIDAIFSGSVNIDRFPLFHKLIFVPVDPEEKV